MSGIVATAVSDGLNAAAADRARLVARIAAVTAELAPLSKAGLSKKLSLRGADPSGLAKTELLRKVAEAVEAEKVELI